MKKQSIILFVVSLFILMSCSMEYEHQYKYSGYLFEYLEKYDDGVMFSGLDDTFSKNIYIDTLYIPETIYNQKVVAIGNKKNGNYEALVGGSNINKVVVPNTVKHINYRSFEDWNLESIDLGNNINFIASSAFNNCNYLKKVVIPDSVTKINSSTFYNCYNLSTVLFSDNIFSIGAYSFYNCRGLKDISFNENIIEILDYAFRGCESFTKITLPSKLTKVSLGCFSYCSSLKEIEISENVEEIEEKAFYGCSKLTSIKLNCSIPPKGNGDIPMNNGLKIYVPLDSLEIYKKNASWSNYANCIEAYE